MYLAYMIVVRAEESLLSRSKIGRQADISDTFTRFESIGGLRLLRNKISATSGSADSSPNAPALCLEQSVVSSERRVVGELWLLGERAT